MTDPLATTYVIAYKYCLTDDWHAYRKMIPLGIATQMFQEMQADPLVVTAAVYDLMAWDYGRGTGEPVATWKRSQPAPDARLEY